MKITMDFRGGGPLDGSVSLDREIKAGETYSHLEMVVIIAGATSGYRYNVGHHFFVPSPGWLGRTAVRRPQESGLPPSFEYEITGRLEGDQELLVEATFAGQRPDQAAPVTPDERYL